MANGELITVEYAGPATFTVGTLPRYEVRAWWVIRDEGTIGRVKLAAGRELKKHVTADHVEFVTMDMSTYNTPHLNAMMTFQVLSSEQFDNRKRLAALVVRSCAMCGGDHPCNYLRMPDDSERAVCYTCLNGPALQGVQYRTIAWIKNNGRLQI